MIILNGHGVDKRFLMRLNLQQFAEPSGDDNSGGDPAGNDQNNAGGDDNNGGGEGGKDNNPNSLESQLEQLRADLAKQKQALDAATSEAAKYKKELRTKQTQEEIDAANKKEEQEKRDREFAELQKKVARAEGTKNVMAKLGIDEDAAGQIAESMIGCENADNALLLIKKAWDAKEKALRQEFGKIPGPGAGGSGNKEDDELNAAIELGTRLGKERAEANKSTQEGLQGYLR